MRSVYTLRSRTKWHRHAESGRLIRRIHKKRGDKCNIGFGDDKFDLETGYQPAVPVIGGGAVAVGGGAVGVAVAPVPSLQPMIATTPVVARRGVDSGTLTTVSSQQPPEQPSAPAKPAVLPSKRAYYRQKDDEQRKADMRDVFNEFFERNRQAFEEKGAREDERERRAYERMRQLEEARERRHMEFTAALFTRLFGPGGAAAPAPAAAPDAPASPSMVPTRASKRPRKKAKKYDSDAEE